jgi:hypothetical protein
MIIILILILIIIISRIKTINFLVIIIPVENVMDAGINNNK